MMMAQLSRVWRCLALLGLFVIGAGDLAAQDALTIVDAGGSARRYTAEQLHSIAADTVRLTLHHQTPATYTTVPLRQLLALGGVNVDSLKGMQLATVVVAEARDGYRVAISLGEMAPGLGGRDVLIAYRRDGAPIGGDEGPFRLIVRGDERAARSSRQLITLRVVNAAAK